MMRSTPNVVWSKSLVMSTRSRSPPNKVKKIDNWEDMAKTSSSWEGKGLKVMYTAILAILKSMLTTI